MLYELIAFMGYTSWILMELIYKVGEVFNYAEYRISIDKMG